MQTALTKSDIDGWNKFKYFSHTRNTVHKKEFGKIKSMNQNSNTKL